MSHPHILYRVPTGKRRRDRDSDTVTSIVHLAAEETNIRVASGTVKSVGLPETTVDLYTPVIEAATVESIVVLLPDGQGDERDYPADAGTVTSVGGVSLSVEALTYVAENTVITSISQISSSDTHGSVAGTNYIDAATVTAVASISATQIYTTPNDAATITAVSVPTAAEVTTYVTESGLVTSTANFVTATQTIFIDPAPNLTNIVTTVASVSAAVETVAWNPDAATIIALAVPVSAPTDAAAYIDNTQYLTTSVSLRTQTSLTLTRPVSGTTVASGTEGSTDAGTTTAVAIATATEIGPIRVTVPVATASASGVAPLLPSQPVSPPKAIASIPALTPSNTLLPASGLLPLGLPIPAIQLRLAPPVATATASVPAVAPGVRLFPPVSTASAIGTPTPASSIGGGVAPPGNTIAGWNLIVQDGLDWTAALGTWPNDQESGSTDPPGTNPAINGWKAYPNGWSDGMSGTYSPSRGLSVHDSVLDMYLHTDVGTGAAIVNVPYILVPGANAQNGLSTMRAAVRWKSESAPGYHIAFLLWPNTEDAGTDTWPHCGEIDWPEANLGGSDTLTAFMHRYAGTSAGDQDTYDSGVVAGGTGWHESVTEFIAGTRCTFYLDGVKIGESLSRVPVSACRWVLQVTTTDAGPPDPGTAAHLYVDWVAVYGP